MPPRTKSEGTRGKTMSRKKPDDSQSLSRIKRRMVDSHVAIAADPPEKIAYQHTVLCQTVLPYRNPGDEIREWQRDQGNVSLLVEAGRAKDPNSGKWVKLGLPFGPKVRLVLHYLNTEAIKTGSPTVEVEDSMTAFVSRIQRYAPNGQEIRTFKDQLTRLSAATLRLAVRAEDRILQVNSQIITAFDLWFSKDDKQRVLWPSTVRLSEEYFKSLMEHAVPLDERAIAGLSHSAMALDVYCWLAQRLHRVKGGQFIPWTALQEQFGQGYKQIRQFRAAFKKALRHVLLHYPAARVTANKEGMLLANSSPPVQKRIVLVEKS
jgi:hypothetical protein